MKRLWLFSALCFVLPVSKLARATVIYNSLNDGSNGTYAIENINDGNVTWASEFLTPSGSTLPLTDVIAMLEQGIGSGSVSAYLYSNTATGNAPNLNLATIATVPQSSIPVSPGEVAFTAPTGVNAITLLPSTEYWVVMSGADDSVVDARWQYGTSDTGPGATGIAGQNIAEWDGVAWYTLSNDSDPSGIPEMEVDASATPEPGTFAILAIGSAGLLIGRRSRRAS